MQDGQFSLPDVYTGTPSSGSNGFLGGTQPITPEYKPVEYTPYMPAFSPAKPTLDLSPDLYENVKIANQSGFTNWWGSLVNSWNDTQIGVGAADLMDGLKKKANTQNALNQLEADLTTGSISEPEYMLKKSKIYDELTDAYNTISKARRSMYNDEEDKYTISKEYQYKSNIANLQGSDASLGDQLKYQVPNMLGSSLSLMGQGIMAAFGEKMIQTAVTRGIAGAVAGSEVPGLGNAIGLVVGFGSTLAVNLFTRNLESKAEVGSQFLQDYDMLKGEYLKDRPLGYELSEDEDNKLILQASQGADDLYNKNMSLALTDTLQSLIFAGSFNKMLSKFGNLNKFTRLAVQAGGFYANKKLEGLEEGLQYAWSSEKTLASLGLPRTNNIFSSLVQDYKDVVSSMDFLGISGKGPYSQDKQFLSSVHSGELLGGMFGAVHMGTSIAKDAQAYLSVNKELAALNPTKVDAPMMKFKDELYASFFGPKKAGVVGLLSQDSDDRVFYFKEALKNLSKQRTEDGKYLLDKDELKEELVNIDKAYSTFKDINSTLDGILSPYGKGMSKTLESYKTAFRDQLFHNTMQLSRLEGTVRTRDAEVAKALQNLDDISRITGKIGVIDERLKNATGNTEKFLNAQKRELNSELKAVRTTADALDNKVPSPQNIDQQAYTAISKFYDAAETQFDYQEKRKKLSKVKDWNGLSKWATTDYVKSAPEAYMNIVENAAIEDNKTFAEGIGTRTEVSELNEDELKSRTAQNKDILSRAGFTKSYFDTLSDEDLDLEAEKVLEDFRKGVSKISEDSMLSLIANADSKDELMAYLSRPSFRAAFNDLNYNINDDIDTLRDLAVGRIKSLAEERRTKKVRIVRPKELEVNNGSKIVGRVKAQNDTRETSDYITEFNISQGKAKQVDVLNAIINSRFSTDAEKALARQLLAVTTNEEIIFRENYRPLNPKDGLKTDPNTGKPVGGSTEGFVRRPGTATVAADGTVQVVVDLGHFGDEVSGNQQENFAPAFETVILHELIHRYTAISMRKDPEALAEIAAIREQARDKAKADGVSYYGTSNNDDFLAEAMTSPDFQKFLASIEGTGKETLWQSFINAVTNLLKRAFGIEISGTALEDVINITSGLIGGKGAGKKGSIVVSEGLKTQIEEELSKFNINTKDAALRLQAVYSKLLDNIIAAINENDLSDALRDQLTNFLSEKSSQVEAAIKVAREENNKLDFQGKTYNKGTYVALKGYAEPYWIAGVSNNGLEVRSKDGSTKITITSSDDIVSQGNESDVQEYLDAEARPEKVNRTSPEFYKSIQDEFEKKDGVWVESQNPIVIKFQNFIKYLAGINMAKSQYKGLLVQDNDEKAGFAIPRSQETKEGLASGSIKEGQVVVVVDQNGTPVKFDDNFNPSDKGEYVVFNIETYKTVMTKSNRAIADRYGISVGKAGEFKREVAEKIANARKRASQGEKVFLDFEGINPGVSSNAAAQEVEMLPVSPEDSDRVVRLLNYFKVLPPEEKKNAQTVKDFIFNFVIGKTQGSKISGGKIYINDVEVSNPTSEDIINNFNYKRVFSFANANTIYDLKDVKDGQLVTTKSFPTYSDYEMTVMNLSSPITRSTYNGYILYQFSDSKPTKVESNPELREDELPKKDVFEGGTLFDVSISDPIEDLKSEVANFTGIYKGVELTTENINTIVEQSLDNRVTAEKLFGKKAVDIIYYRLATPTQIQKAYNFLDKNSETPEDYDHLIRLMEDRDMSFDTSIAPVYGNELGLFDNKTTIDLVKSLDKGLYNYIYKTSSSVVKALSDTDFIDKALRETRNNVIARLEILKNDRKNKLDAGNINQAYYDAQIAALNDKIDKLNNQWDKIFKYYKDNSYVFTFKTNLSYKYDENGELVQEGDDRVAKDKGFDKIGNEVSPIDGASKETKSLIRGLGRYKRVGDKFQRVGNSFNVPELVNFAVTWNNLIKNLQGVTTTEEMFDRLESMQSRFPEYEELLSILRGSDKTAGYYQKAISGDFESISMLSKFYKDFINPEIPVIQNLIDLEGGTVFKVEEATRKNVKDLRKQALDNFRFKSKYTVNTTQGNKVLDSNVTALPTKSSQERVAFLEALGVPLSQETINDPSFNTVASSQILQYIKNEITELTRRKILIKDPISDLSSGRITGLGVGKRFNDILTLESKYTETTPTLSMQNVEDNTEYAISRPNFYSTVIKAINHSEKYPTFQALVAEPQYSYLNKPYARTSLVLNTVFVLDSKKNYGERRIVNGKPVTLKLNNISGTQVQDGTGKKTTSMFIGDKIVSDINQFLKSGFKEFTRAGDKNSSFGLKVSTFIQPGGSGILPINNLDLFKGANGYGGEQFKNIMANYLKGEVARIILARQNKLTDIFKMDTKGKSILRNVSLFKSLLGESVVNELYASIDALPNLEPNSDEFYYQAQNIADDYISRTGVMKGIKEFLRDEVIAKQESLNNYGFSFNDRFWLDDSFKNLDPNTILRAYIVNEFIMHVEQTKLFNGDVVFYSTKDGEFHKRTPANGATGLSPINDAWFVNALNSMPNTNLQAKLLGVNNVYSNVLKTTVFAENIPNSVYLENWRKELNGRGLSKDDISRIVDPYDRSKGGGLKEADAQGWVTMDYYRSFKISIGDWRVEQEEVFERVSKGETLTVQEVEDFNRLFPPIKAQYSGPMHNEVYHIPAFHKFSLMPLIPSAIRGSALEVLNERMLRNNISYALMQSGSKVGTQGESLEAFYSNFNSRTMKAPTEPFNNENLIHTQFLKEQVQIEPELHDTVIFGTQFRKLLFQNVYDSGKPYNAKLARLEQQYTDLINEITEHAKDNLITDMGISPILKDGKVVDYEVKNSEKLLGRIREEIKRRNLNNSIKDFFELENGKLKYPLDASINHQQVRTLIMSMINTKLIRQTIKGDMAVQASGLGFEKLVKPTDADILEYGTNGLRFYNVKDGKVRKMQVKTSLTGDFKYLLNLTYKGEKVGNLESLNQALKDENFREENSKKITMIGYRIPTQGLNSIEMMEVAEFLPPETGGILIVPTEIVGKAGSDFDIDKLNIFKPSLNNDGSYVERSKKRTKESVDQTSQDVINQIKELNNKKKSYNFFSSLPDKERDEFMQGLEKDLPSAKSAELAQIGITIKSLREKIQSTDNIIKSLEEELRAGFDQDTYEELVGMRAEQMDYKIYLADELDRKQAVKRNLLLESGNAEDIDKNEEILDALYDKLVADTTDFNDQIDQEIKNLRDYRATILNRYRNYKVGLFNSVIDLAVQRLEDADSFAELITPNSTDLIKPKVQEISAKTGIGRKSYLHTNNLTSSTQEEKFLAGIPNKKALGIAAVANTMSQLFNKVEVKVNPQFIKNNVGREVIHPMVDNLDFSGRTLKNGMLKSEIESQMINAYVDVLNDDFISKANLSLDTAGTFFYLLHLGHDPHQLMDFFNHPVIKAYIAELQKNKSIITKQVKLNRGEAANLEAIQNGDEPIERLEAYLSSEAKQEAFYNATALDDKFIGHTVTALRKAGITTLKKRPDIFSANNLQDSVGKELKDINQFDRLAILSYYINVIEESGELLKLQQSNNYDTSTSVNPVSGEIRNLTRTQLDMGNLFNTTDISSKTVVGAFDQTTLTGSILDAVMPITLNSRIREEIVNIISVISNDVDEDRATRTFINDWLQFLAFNLGETASGQNLGEYSKSLLFNNNQFISNLLEFKLNDTWKNLRTDYPVINNLRADSYLNIGNISLYREDNSSDYQNAIIEQFQALAAFDDAGYSEGDRAKVSKFFKDLMILGFAQSGLNKSPISFSDLVPNEYYAPMMTKALDKYKSMDKNHKDTLLSEFIAKFRDLNTNIMGKHSNIIPYWRFKDYTKSAPTLQTNTSGIRFEEEPTTGYRNRTIKNASADATIALATDFNSAGEKLTKSSVKGQNKLYMAIDLNKGLVISNTTVNEIVKRLNSVNAKTLNIAGNGIYTMNGKYTQAQLDEYTYNLLNQVVNHPDLKNKIESIRSGGQTGMDEAGAKAGIRLGIPTSILAPRGWKFRNAQGQDISDEAQFKARFGTQQGDQLSLGLDTSIGRTIENGTFEALLSNLQEYGLIKRICK